MEDKEIEDYPGKIEDIVEEELICPKCNKELLDVLDKYFGDGLEGEIFKCECGVELKARLGINKFGVIGIIIREGKEE